MWEPAVSVSSLPLKGRGGCFCLENFVGCCPVIRGEEKTGQDTSFPSHSLSFLAPGKIYRVGLELWPWVRVGKRKVFGGWLRQEFLSFLLGLVFAAGLLCPEDTLITQYVSEGEGERATKLSTLTRCPERERGREEKRRDLAYHSGSGGTFFSVCLP